MLRNIDWKNLGFGYSATKGHSRADFSGGAWGPVRESGEEYVPLHLAASCLHYGQECFEGMKAFTQKDGSVRIFRPDENFKRMRNTAIRLCMESPTEEIFMEAVTRAVRMNLDFMPPYGTGASMYIRPLLLGTSARIGVSPSEDYSLFALAMPVGPYYKNGFIPIDGYVHDRYDRAAPRGVGNVKVGGNYATALYPDSLAKKEGCPISLYLDAVENSYIEEFSTSNFFGITKDGAYVTPRSPSILPSITNMSLETIAADLGLRVERRPVHVRELDSFVEVGACGTAAVITPIQSLRYKDKVHAYGEEGVAGPTLVRLYRRLLGIQCG